MQVREIKAEDTYHIRQQVLREGRPIETCRFDGDHDELTFHLGAFEKNRLISIASFYFENHPDVIEKNQFRLRGMATFPEHQGKGLSSALLKTAFPLLKRNQSHMIWCNARKSAIGFYQKVGFDSIGGPFEIPDVGPHVLMIKKI